MMEHIEREAATAYAPLPKHLREYQTGNLDDAFEYGYDFAIKQLEAIPAADVVPWSWLEQYAHGKMMNYASGFVFEAKETYTEEAQNGPDH